MGIVSEMILSKSENLVLRTGSPRILPGQSKKAYLNFSCLKYIAICKLAIQICTSIKKKKKIKVTSRGSSGENKYLLDGQTKAGTN